jgi:hypothetical protein
MDGEHAEAVPPPSADRADLPRCEEIPEFARLLVIRRLAMLPARRAADRPVPVAGATPVVASGERDEPPRVG